MAKRRPAPSQDEIKAAIDAAREGKGRALAVMIKSFSVDDLAKGFSGGNWPPPFSFMDPYAAISSALSCAAGRKSFRDDFTAKMRDADKRARRAQKAEASP